VTFLALISIAIKLFLVEVRYPDDPTIGLAVRAAPSLHSYSRNPDAPVVGYLWIDESDYPGSALFRWMAGADWLASRARTGSRPLA
jgi:hypothetical protein